MNEISYNKLPRTLCNFTGLRPCESSRSQIEKQRFTGQYDDDVIEFARAIAQAQSEKGSVLVSSEIFEVMWNLRYRKLETCIL